jgi:hypothetical protein
MMRSAVLVALGCTLLVLVALGCTLLVLGCATLRRS